MKLIILALLIPVLLVLEGNCSSCFESHELETRCSGYCYDVVKPLLDHTRVCYKQSEEKNAITMEERFKSHFDSLQNNELKFLANFEINIKEMIDNALQKQNQKIDSVITEKLLNHDKTFEKSLQNISEVTAKLESLNKVMHDILKVQADQYKTKAIPNLFTKIESKYYHISVNKADWHSSIAICRSMGGNLVTFESEYEFDAVTRHLETHRIYWTSLNNFFKKHNFVSISTGKAAPYLNWHSGEPSHKYKNELEYCVQVEYKNGFKMNDRHWSNMANYICEAEN